MERPHGISNKDYINYLVSRINTLEISLDFARAAHDLHFARRMDYSAAKIKAGEAAFMRIFAEVAAHDHYLKAENKRLEAKIKEMENDTNS